MNSVVAKSGGGRQVAPVSRQVATVSPFRKQLAALKRRPLSDLDNLGAEIDDVAATRQKLLDKEKYLVDWTPVGRLDEFKRKLEALKECGILDSAKRLAVRLDDYFLDEHDPNELASVFVAELVGAFPSGKPTDPEVYVKALIAEVAAVDPSCVEIETAVRAVRRKKPSCRRLLRCWPKSETPNPFGVHAQTPYFNLATM